MSPLNTCIPFFEPANRVTAKTTADVVGKRFVKVSAAISGGIVGANNPNVAHATANGPAYGVSEYDAASGNSVGVLKGHGMVVPVTADGAITAGDEIMVGTAGKAKTYVGPSLSGNAETLAVVRVVGYAVDSAADGADCAVELRF